MKRQMLDVAAQGCEVQTGRSRAGALEHRGREIEPDLAVLRRQMRQIKPGAHHQQQQHVARRPAGKWRQTASARTVRDGSQKCIVERATSV